MGTRKVRLRDIADCAGVSVSTVSLVLNNKTMMGNVRISEETSRRVRGIALEMGYLEKGIIGLIVPEIINYFLPMIYGIMRVLREENYSLAMGLATQWHLQSEIDEVRLIEEKGFDCLIMAPTPQFVDWSEKTSYPFQYRNRVVLMNWTSHSDIPSVTIDHEDCGYQATRYLLDQGHRQIAFSAYQVYPSEDYVSGIPIIDARFRGYLKALREFALPYISVENAQDVFASPQKATAVYCSRAAEAARFLGYCWDHDIKIPDRLSVVGQDDNSEKQIVRPCVTTVDVQADEVGAIAARKALDLINNRSVKSKVLKPRLIERESVRAL